MIMTTGVDRIMAEHSALVALLEKAGEISMVSSVDAVFRKSLALSAASYFEVKIRDCVLGYVTEKSAGDEGVVSFLRIKGIERQYHTYFDWKNRSATPFFSLFGQSFKQLMARRIVDDEEMRGAVDAFLELGDLRNNLAHQDFAVFPMEKTVAEIYALYVSALKFVDTLPLLLHNKKLGEVAAVVGDIAPSP